MTRTLFRTFRFGLAAAVVGCFGGPAMAAPIPLTANWQANAYNQPMPNGVHATLSSESATGYTYTRIRHREGCRARQLPTRDVGQRFTRTLRRSMRREWEVRYQ